MNYSYGTNADKYLNEEGLQYLITKIKEMSGGTIDLTNYYNKTEVDDLLANIEGTVGTDGVGIQSVALTNYELIITLTDATVINLGNVRGAIGLNGTNGTNGIDGEQGIQGLTGSDGADGTNGADGRGISTIVKTGTVDLIDTYTITYSDATTSTFTVTNGSSGDGGGSSLPSYLTTETIVGTWLDGKTIYRKCFTFGALGVEETTFSHNIANISDIVDIRQHLVVGSNTYVGGNWIVSYRPTTYNKNDVSIVYATPTSVKISIGANIMNGSLIVYMDYTKTV